MSRSCIRLGTLALLAALTGLVPAGAQPVQLAQPAQPGGKQVGRPTTPAETTLTDEEALKAADLSPTDGAKLVAYLKQRTLSDAEQGRIKEVIARFAADDFDARLKAVAEVEQFGPAAIGPLKAAEKDADPEVSYRATQALKKLEKVPHSAVAAAAVRAVVKLKPPEAASALLGFLPLADSEAVADEIREALVALALRDGKPDPAIVAALKDPLAVRRGAAYVALVEGGPAGERVRIKETYPQVKAAVRQEADVDAKFRGLWALTLTTRDKEFVPDLIGMIPQLPRGRIWQLEEFLLQLAGTHPAGGRFGKSAEALGKAKDAWAAWWQQKGGAVDLAKLDFKPRVFGYTDLVEMDYRGFGQGRVVCLGPDLKEAWRLAGVTSATDARVLPSGHILVVEMTFSRVTERDLNGKIVVERRSGGQPLSAEPLPDGGLLVVSRNSVIEYDKDGKSVNTYTRPSYDIMAGRRLPNGDTLFVTTAFQGNNCFRLDSKLKETGKPLTLGRMQNNNMLGMIDVIGEEAVLVTEMDKVAEYDLKTGKMGWKHAFNQPTSVQRLPNGNTLVASLNQNRAVEVDPDGNEVWDYSPKDGMRVARAYRR